MFVGVDYLSGKPHSYNGTVIDHGYTPEINSTGTGTAFVNGKVGVVTTHNHQAEEWKIMVRNSQNIVVAVECDATTYYNFKNGDSVFYIAITGGLSKSVYSPEKLKVE